jgi:hypothetical protein
MQGIIADMTHLTDYELILYVLGLATGVWAAGLTVYVLHYDRRQRALSMSRLTAAFTALVAELGHRLRGHSNPPFTLR